MIRPQLPRNACGDMEASWGARFKVENLTMRFGGPVALNDAACRSTRAPCSPSSARTAPASRHVQCHRRLADLRRGDVDGTEITGRPSYDVVDCGIARTFSRRGCSRTSASSTTSLSDAHPHEDRRAGCAVPPGASRRDGGLRGKASAAQAWFRRPVRTTLPAGGHAGAGRQAAAGNRPGASPRSPLLLDEPSVGMDDTETDALVADIARLRVENPDLSVVLIEHDMRVVEAFRPRHLHRLWRKIAEGDFAAARRPARPGSLSRRRSPMLELRDVDTSYGPVPMLRGVAMSVRPGELVRLLGRRRQDDNLHDCLRCCRRPAARSR